MTDKLAALPDDYSKIARSIADTIAKGGRPLSASQRSLLAGALSVWLDKAIKEAMQAQRKRDIDACAGLSDAIECMRAIEELE